MSAVLKDAIEHWEHVAPIVARPENDADLDRLIAYLDELLDIVGDNEDHPLMGLVDVLGHLVEGYENERFEEPAGKGVDALRYLMEIHGLRQSDLPEIGTQGVISEILHGRRSLNLRQIKNLSERFKVTPETFIN